MDPGRAMSSDQTHRHLRKKLLARHRRKTTREEAQQSLRLLDGLSRGHPVSEGCPYRADSGMAVPKVLGVRR